MLGVATFTVYAGLRTEESKGKSIAFTKLFIEFFREYRISIIFEEAKRKVTLNSTTHSTYHVAINKYFINIFLFELPSCSPLKGILIINLKGITKRDILFLPISQASSWGLEG